MVQSQWGYALTPTHITRAVPVIMPGCVGQRLCTYVYRIIWRVKRTNQPTNHQPTNDIMMLVKDFANLQPKNNAHTCTGRAVGTSQNTNRHIKHE
jgi:hypothetical protein